jgi:hypothetical protein
VLSALRKRDARNLPDEKKAERKRKIKDTSAQRIDQERSVIRIHANRSLAAVAGGKAASEANWNLL